MFKKSVISVMCIVLIVTGLVACSNPSNNSNGTEGVKTDTSTGNGKEPVTISFWYPSENNDEFYETAVAEFEKIHEHITVDLQALPPVTKDIDIKLNSAKLGGTYPDVFAAFLVFIGTRGARGEFASLDEFIENWDEKDDIFESTYETGTYQGNVLGLGYFPNPKVLAYRKDYFREAGLDPESPPTNWDELAEYAKQLTVTDENGAVVRAGFDIPAMDGSFSYVESFFRQNGSKLIDEDLGVPAFNDEKSVGALEFLVNLKDEIGHIPFDTQKGADDLPFMNGRSAMANLNLPWVMRLIRERPELEEELGIAPVLKQEDQVAFAGYRLYTIGADSDFKEESWELIKFLVSKENMWKQYVENGIPVVRKSLEEDFVNDNPAFNGPALDYIRYGKGKAVVPWTSLYNQYISQAYELAMNHVQTPAEALEEMQRQLEIELEKIAN